jgi:hypothetical protein
MATESQEPGWESIDAAFAEVYPGVEPHHVAPALPTALGGALDGIGRYKLLQLVGITAAELGDMKASSTQEGLDRLRDHDPLLRTDPGRR